MLIGGRDLRQTRHGHDFPADRNDELGPGREPHLAHLIVSRPFHSIVCRPLSRQVLARSSKNPAGNAVRLPNGRPGKPEGLPLWPSLNGLPTMCPISLMPLYSANGLGEGLKINGSFLIDLVATCDHSHVWSAQEAFALFPSVNSGSSGARPLEGYLYEGEKGDQPCSEHGTTAASVDRGDGVDVKEQNH